MPKALAGAAIKMNKVNLRLPFSDHYNCGICVPLAVWATGRIKFPASHGVYPRGEGRPEPPG
jgi:hypothetical protein